MNKIKLSIFVITSFIIYSFISRSTGSSNPQIIATKQVNSIQGNNSSRPTNTPQVSQTTPSITSSPISTPIAGNNTSVPTPIVTPTPTPTQSSKYKDGTYTGNPADAFYGNIQVAVTISGGNITKVKFLQAPGGRSTSVQINSQADPILAQEAIQTQSANVNIVSGATDSSEAFIQSLQSALNQAQA